MRKRFVPGAVGVVLAALSVAAISPGVGAQESQNEAGVGELDGEVRVVARRIADGRTEFAPQHRPADGEWVEVLVPGPRLLPTGVEFGGWLAGGEVTLNLAPGPAGDTVEEIRVRIVMRPLADGRIEFGLQQRRAGGRWGEHLLPPRRFLPARPTIGRWLSSSPLTLRAERFDGFTVGGGSRSGNTLIAAAQDRTCAVRPTGGVTCWGRDGLLHRLSVASLDDVLAVSTSAAVSRALHTCVLHGDGAVSCWGPGSLGQLGQGDTVSHYLPVKIPELTDAVALAAGDAHTCVVHSDGGVSCWGSGTLGQMGDGSEEQRNAPQRVPGLEDVATIAAGSHSTCGVHTDGSLSCWGWGATTHKGYLSPTRVGGLGPVASVSIGWGHACVVRTDGRVDCWLFSDTVWPQEVAGIDDAVAVAAGIGGNCVLHRDGGVSCWGENNAAGQLGNGSTDPLSRPERVVGVTDAVAITRSVETPDGEAHACAVHGDGSVSCWGGNTFGQLGDGTLEDRMTPTRVAVPAAIPAEGVPTDPDHLLRTWVDAVVEEQEATFPWLREAWDLVREQSFLVGSSEYGGAASTSCSLINGSYSCRGLDMNITDASAATVVHELAHVYDFTTGLAPRRAWGAVQLYFAASHPECFTKSSLGAGVEILADTMEHLVLPEASLSYYNTTGRDEAIFDSPGCPTLPEEPSLEAEEVVLAGLAGEIPDWYTQNITNGAELWAALRRAPSVRMLANLAGEFGGLCTSSWFALPLDVERLPSEGTNPFRDGGC